MKILNELVLDQLDDIYSLLDSSTELKTMLELKNKIKADESIKRSLVLLEKLAANPYSNEYISLRKELFSNPFIKDYKEAETELYYLTLSINIKLNSLLKEKKGCL
ncbi:MAG: YlbF family regulator [Bacilli bacterium]